MLEVRYSPTVNNFFATFNFLHMMTLRIWLAACLFISFSAIQAQANFSYDEDTLVLRTQKYKGFGPFKEHYTYLSADGFRPGRPWEVAYPSYQLPAESMPTQFVSTNLLINSLSLYQANEKVGVDSAYYARSMKKASLQKADFYLDPPAPILSLMIGQDSSEQLWFRYDQDGDHNFRDETWQRVLDTKTATETGTPASHLMPHVFSYKRKGKLKQDTLWFTLSPGDIPFDIGYPVVFFNMGEHRLATFSLEGADYTLALSNGGISWTYGYPNLSLLDAEGNAGEEFEPGDYLKLGEQAYRFESCDVFGETIKLTRIDNFAELEGRQVGMQAVRFQANSIQGEEIALTDYKGKYVYLDFWGTWCGPCVEEVPTVKKVYEAFGDEAFAIIGIALDDSARLADFVAENEMVWPQILQTDDQDPKSILKRYKISGYPTTFLVNPEGQVEERGLRGGGLITYLAKKFPLTEAKAQLFLEGEYHFSLPGFKEAESVSALIYDAAGDKSTIGMFPVNGRWVGATDLEPGTYTYLFKADKKTLLDPNAKETKGVDGETRAVLQVK